MGEELKIKDRFSWWYRCSYALSTFKHGWNKNSQNVCTAETTTVAIMMIVLICDAADEAVSTSSNLASFYTSDPATCRH